MRSEIENTIRETLKRIDQFTTPEGLFRTYRMDYSRGACPNDYIDEGKATFIDTKYDHAFILNILFGLRKYFPSEKRFLGLLKRGLKLIMDDAVVTEQTINGKKVKTLQWRHYNIPHKGSQLILPDIDNTGRRLMVIERARQVYGDGLISSLTDNPGLFRNRYNYKQLWSLLSPVDNEFRLCRGNPKYHGMVTHFGYKPGNDVDPVCNIVAVQSTLMFLNKNISFLTGGDVRCLSKLCWYLNAFINSGEYGMKTHEYYEPVVVAYCYSKLIEFCGGLQPQLKGAVAPLIGNKERLRDMVFGQMNGGVCKNALETALSVTSLIALGYRGPELKAGVDFIMESRNPDYSWSPYRFYRQRHPHRIFGSRGLTTSVCLEALEYRKSRTKSK